MRTPQLNNPPDSPRRQDQIIFSCALLVLTLFSLWPIWANRFLPMQDYPQHLFLAHLISTYDTSSFNWKEFYTVQLGFRPYMLWYLAMKFLAQVVDIETAGKLLFSLYILLITTLACIARRLPPKGFLPWGALLIYPLAFNQMYYMGMANYLMSLPVLFIALLDLDHLANGLTIGRMARHGFYCLILFLNHPYTVLVYIALAIISASGFRKNRNTALQMLFPAGIMSLSILLWYIFQHGAGTTPTSVPWTIYWWPYPWQWLLAYFVLPFSGMRLFSEPQWLACGLWCIIAALFIVAWRQNNIRDAISRRLLLFSGAGLAGFIALPFWVGYYSYFNLRMAPVSYFALALALCGIRVSVRAGMFLVVSVLLLLTISIQTQSAVARETQTILPAVSAAQQNSLILPLMFETSSDAIDQICFDQIHAHDADYYHLAVGGGANPTLFPNAMMPVLYKPGLRLPYPHKPLNFTWQEHGRYYDYILVRKPPPEFSASIKRESTLVTSSGPWVLFKNKSARKPL
jgi:hypothetical protein